MQMEREICEQLTQLTFSNRYNLTRRQLIEDEDKVDTSNNFADKQIDDNRGRWAGWVGRKALEERGNTEVSIV